MPALGFSLGILLTPASAPVGPPSGPDCPGQAMDVLSLDADPWPCAGHTWTRPWLLSQHRPPHLAEPWIILVGKVAQTWKSLS